MATTTMEDRMSIFLAAAMTAGAMFIITAIADRKAGEPCIPGAATVAEGMAAADTEAADTAVGDTDGKRTPN